MKKVINILIILGGIALCVYIVILASAKNRQNGANNKSVPAAESTTSTKQIARVKVATIRPRGPSPQTQRIGDKRSVNSRGRVSAV